jgi:hypothetical protein
MTDPTVCSAAVQSAETNRRRAARAEPSGIWTALRVWRKHSNTVAALASTHFAPHHLAIRGPLTVIFQRVRRWK